MSRYINEFSESLKAAGKSQNTVSTYVRNATLFIQWLENIVNEPFDGTITILDAAEYSKFLTDTSKQSLNSIKAKLTALQKFADFLASAGYMQPVKLPMKKGSFEPDIKVLEKNDLYKFLRYTINTGNLMNIAIVQLILNTGIRESELCNLELSDIEISDRKGEITIRSGKGNKFRVIPLNKDARNALINYMQNCRPADSTTKKVFIGQRGALTRTAVYKIINKLGEQSINKSVSPHMLRHQCFTAMAKSQSVDLKTISSLAGHSSTELTTRFYINSSKQEKIDAVESLSFF